MFGFCYLLHVYMCSYHHYDSEWLSIFHVYSFLQVKPGAIPDASGLSHLRNSRQDCDDAIFPIVWSAAVAIGLDKIHPYCVVLYLHFLTVQQIGTVGAGAYV